MKTFNSKVLHTIDAHTLKQWLDREAVTLIDVREPSEHAREHLADSLLFPLSEFEPHKINLEHNKRLVLYCRAGHRSAQAAQKLFAAGFEEVTHLGGGIEDWKKRGLLTIVNSNFADNITYQLKVVSET
jgi:rhodanese-related sulfurtransferase